MTKTSISLNEKTLKDIDDYRRTQPKIPKLSEAIRNLLKKALKTKEENTEIPKEYIKFEDKSITYQESRNRFSITFYPNDVEKIIAKGHAISKETKIDVLISIKKKKKIAS